MGSVTDPFLHDLLTASDLMVSACGIDDRGVVYGTLRTSVSGAYIRDDVSPFVWRNGHARSIPTTPLTEEVFLKGSNNRGDSVGGTSDPGTPDGDDFDYEKKAYLRRNDGTWIDLGPIKAECLNYKEQVVVQTSDGNALNTDAQIERRATDNPAPSVFVWQRGQRRPIVPPPGYGLINGFAGINNAGQIAGSVGTGHFSRVLGDRTTTHAFFWQDGKMRDLGTLGGEFSEAHGINGWGQVVGQASMGPPDEHGNESTHAFLWHNGRMYDLNGLIPAQSGWILYSADGINNRGQIVGWGNKGAFLLNPR